MKLKTLKNLLGAGKFATLTYETADGAERVINGRVGVRKYTTGKGMKYNPDERDLLIIWETLRPQDTDRDGTKRYRALKAARI